MECRLGCGACCTVISISSPIPGMPEGKPAGIRCIHLTDDYKCVLFNTAERPWICGAFQADVLICGNSREEAITIIAQLEGLDPEKYI
jgi:uncharacterized protein